MSDLDNQLENQLKALEKGANPEPAPESADELVPLVNLAAAIRQLPHPKLEPEKARNQREALKIAGRKLARPRRRFEWGNLNWTLSPAMVAITLVVLVTIAGVFAAGAWWLGPLDARAASLIEVNGRVEVASSLTAGDWRPVSSGARVHSGERLRTMGASSATLLFYEGSRTTIGANSDLSLTTVRGDWGKVLQVAITQYNGKTNSSVVPLRGAGSSFVVLTPSGVVSVHGTKFNVAVDQKGRARFAVNSGKVQVTNATSEVFLLAGQAATANLDAGISQPAYQFTLAGTVTRMETEFWTIAGVNFTVGPDTDISGDPQYGDTVTVEGRILSGNIWQADSIEPVSSDNEVSTFTGRLESMDGTTWKISGQKILITNTTDLGEGLHVGDSVRVDFVSVMAGWQAIQIQPLDEPSTEPAPTPAPTAAPNARPELVFRPESQEMDVCGTSASLTSSLENTSKKDKDFASNVILGYEAVKGAEYISGVNLDPTTWERIDAGQTVNFTLSAAFNDNWQAAADGTQAMVQVYVADESNRLGPPLSRLSVLFTKHCEEEPTETFTPTATLTATLTATPTLTPTVTATPVLTATATEIPLPTSTAITDCTGNHQPHAQTLADRYGVTYEEIMGWFCQHFGFGEIDLAYSLSQETGVPVADIFQMKTDGMGWGNIRKELLNDAFPGSGTNPGQGNPPSEPPGQSKDKGNNGKDK